MRKVFKWSLAAVATLAAVTVILVYNPNLVKGALDLKTEALRFNFNATPNNALKMGASELINPYILVGGTLAKPDIGIDPSKVLVYGGAAIGTAGISILAKAALDRMGATVPSCEKILEQETPH